MGWPLGIGLVPSARAARRSGHLTSKRAGRYRARKGHRADGGHKCSPHALLPCLDSASAERSNRNQPGGPRTQEKRSGFQAGSASTSVVKHVTALSAVCVIALGLGASTAHARVRAPSVAYKMAVIDCKCVPSAAKVATYSKLLTKLVTRKCKETRLRLADKLVRTQQILAHDGQGHYSLLRLMRLLDKSIPNTVHFRQQCGSVLAALIVLIEKG
jgi:hypothetical protein